jgi:hypothetical protein
MAQGEVMARWASSDGTSTEELRVRFEHGGWTAEGIVRGADVHYVLRFDAVWSLRQLLVFRDLDEPDLWLGTDGTGAWGEVRGARRPDLEGCAGVHLTISPFPLASLAVEWADDPARRGEVLVAQVDVESLGVVATTARWEHHGPAWLVTTGDRADEHRFELDDDGLPGDVEGRFRRLS